MKTKKEKIVGILGAVLPGLAKKDQLAQGQCFVFIDGQVITYNDRVAIHHPLPDELVDLHGAVKATELYSVLSKLPAGIDVDISMTEAEIVVATASVQARVRMEKDIVNKYAAVEIPSKFLKIPEGMLEAARFAAFSASTDLSKPFLTHVYTNENCATACDNHRIMVRKFKQKAPFSAFIPATLVDSLTAYAPAEYACTSGWLHWRNDNGVLFSFRTVEGDYPDVTPFFNGWESWKEITFPEGLSDAVERVSDVLDKDQIHPGVLISFKGNRVVVSGSGPFASMKERLPLASPIEAEFSVAADFFVDVLRLGIKARLSSSRMCLVNDDQSIMHLICLKTPEAPQEEAAAK